MTAPTRLSATSLAKSFHHKTILDGVSVRVDGGEIVGLFGPNGAGKTTCFYLIVGLLAPDRGTIHINDRDISRMPIHKRAQSGIAYLPQEKSIFTDLSAADNIQAILELRRPQDAHRHRELALHLMAEMGIVHLAESPAVTLSGGERRRVEIARLLAQDPAFILMDEPFAALSPVAIQELQLIITDLAARGIGILITDHNFPETLKICHRAYVLHDRRLLATGTPAEIRADTRVQTVYSGTPMDDLPASTSPPPPPKKPRRRHPPAPA